MAKSKSNMVKELARVMGEKGALTNADIASLKGAPKKKRRKKAMGERGALTETDIKRFKKRK